MLRPGIGELPVFDHFAVHVAQAEDLAGAVVAVHVSAVQPRYRGAAIDVTADHGAGFAVQRVFPYGRHGSFALAAVAGAEAVVALQHVPAVVAARPDQVDFFPAILAHVASPQLVGCAVEAEPPRVAQAVGPDFAAPAALGKGVVRRDSVGMIRRCMGYVDAEDGAEQS